MNLKETISTVLNNDDIELYYDGIYKKNGITVIKTKTN